MNGVENIRQKAVTDGEYDTYWATEDSVTSAVIEFEWPAPAEGKPYAVAGIHSVGDSVYSPLWWNIIRKGVAACETEMKRQLQSVINVCFVLRSVTTDKLRVNFYGITRLPSCINNIEAYYAGETLDVFTAKSGGTGKHIRLSFTRRWMRRKPENVRIKMPPLLCFVDGNTLLSGFRYGTDCFFFPLFTRPEQV